MAIAFERNSARYGYLNLSRPKIVEGILVSWINLCFDDLFVDSFAGHHSNLCESLTIARAQILAFQERKRGFSEEEGQMVSTILRSPHTSSYSQTMKQGRFLTAEVIEVLYSFTDKIAKRSIFCLNQNLPHG